MAGNSVVTAIRSSRTLKLLREAGALKENRHFVLTSGLHSSAYIEPDEFLPDPNILSEFGFSMAQWIRDSGYCPDTIAGPETGGAYLAQWTAWHLQGLGQKNVVSVGLKKKSKNSFALSPAHQKFIRDKKIFLADDIFTSGKSIGLSANLCRKFDGTILGAICVLKRGEARASQLLPILGTFPIFSLAELALPDWEEKDCPTCNNVEDMAYFDQ